MVSATTYTLVGVVNKFLTILLNVFLWDKHASWFGIFCVCLCLFSGMFYQQAPKRSALDLPTIRPNKEEEDATSKLLEMRAREGNAGSENGQQVKRSNE